MKFSVVNLSVACWFVGMSLSPSFANADILVNILGRQSVSTSYYSDISVYNNTYIDTTPIVNSLDQINQTLVENSTLRRLTTADRERLANVYELDKFGKLIGINIQGASASRFVKKFGLPVFEQVIEDRLKNLQINTVLVENIGRAMHGKAPFASTSEMKSTPLESSAPFDHAAIAYFVNWGRTNFNSPYKLPDIDDLNELRVLDRKYENDLSLESKKQLAAFFSLYSQNMIRSGASFKRVTYENISERSGDILSTSNQWHQGFRTLLNSDMKDLSKRLLYCEDNLVKMIKDIRSSVYEENIDKYMLREIQMIATIGRSIPDYKRMKPKVWKELENSEIPGTPNPYLIVDLVMVRKSLMGSYVLVPNYDLPVNPDAFAYAMIEDAIADSQAACDFAKAAKEGAKVLRNQIAKLEGSTK